MKGRRYIEKRKYLRLENTVVLLQCSMKSKIDNIDIILRRIDNIRILFFDRLQRDGIQRVGGKTRRPPPIY